MSTRFAARAIAIASLLALAACASAPATRPTPAKSTEVAPKQVIVDSAIAVIGTPYRYGGADRNGFDCSGLVRYAHLSAGIVVPRIARDQQRASQPVPRAELLPGDLVFFSTSGQGTDHVGIYTGAGRFVHAPSSGRVVSYAYLDDPWFASRYVGAGRLWSSAEK